MSQSQPERLAEIVRKMVHNGVKARRVLTRGLIIAYFAPEPGTPCEQARYSMTASRRNYWPDDQELKIVYDCLYKAWRRHPSDLVYAMSDWAKRAEPIPLGLASQAGDMFGTFTVTWQQWPVRDVFSAPPALRETLRAALARR